MATEMQKIRKGLSYRPAVKERNAARQALGQLEHWGGRIVEFLDSFEGSFEDDEWGQEALALQEEGQNLGLKKIYPPKKKEAAEVI